MPDSIRVASSTHAVPSSLQTGASRPRSSGSHNSWWIVRTSAFTAGRCQRSDAWGTMWLKLPQTMAATSSAVVAKQARTRSMAMLGVCSATMARRAGQLRSQAERAAEIPAERCRSYAEPAPWKTEAPQLWGGTLVGRRPCSD